MSSHIVHDNTVGGTLSLTSTKKKLETVTREQPCRHCGKTDWCYRIDELDVCKRGAEPAVGWTKTSKLDSDGTPYYAPIQQKAVRPNQFRSWEYPARDGSKLVRVCRIDDGQGNKKIWQEHWNGSEWVKGLGKVARQTIPIYKFAEVQEAKAQGKAIFTVEGEPVADALWNLGLAATTNIGGSGKWRESDSRDLEGASVILCPDRDKPGVHHMMQIAQEFPEAQYLLAFPESETWQNLPKSQGVDLADWIADYKASADELEKNIIDAEAFRAKLERQVSVAADKPKKDKKDKDELPPASVVAWELAEAYREKLAWESEYQLWRHYEAKYSGVWSEETVESVRGLVHAHLRSLPESPAFSAGYVSSVVTILQSDLEAKEWNEQRGLIPLKDGVLNQETRELQPHSPGYRFTWQLPFKWADRDIGCEPIEDFLLKITGDKSIAEVLLCYLAAVVTRRSDLQRYLELIGGGGTGKSTYMALAKALAGEENAVSSRLSLLEKNQFETAKFYRKLLVLFPDSERWQGEVSILKQMTGQDPIRYERKGVQQCKDYIYSGMVILSANEPPESSDRTSGLERRKLTVELDSRIPEYEERNLIEEFIPYLPGLLKRVLEIPRQRVTNLIKFTERYVPALAQKKWSQMLETNVIAAWLNENVIIAANAKDYIGKDDPSKAGNWLYANFCQFTRESGHKGTLPVKRFSTNLRDLLKNQLKVPIIEGRDRKGAYIQGIGLRCYYDHNGDYYHRPITKDGLCDGLEEKCDGFVTDETLTSDRCDGCDGFNKTQQSSQKVNEMAAFLGVSEDEAAEVVREIDVSVMECEENPSHPSHPSPASVSAVENPSPNPSQEEDGWMTEENLSMMAKDLGNCSSPEELADLREIWPPAAMNAACKRLHAHQHSQIKQWVNELNAKQEIVQPELFDFTPNHSRPGDWDWEH